MAAAAPEPEATPLPRLFPFVFFGCWNRPGEIGGTKILPRDVVAHAVGEMAGAIQTIIIGGDNVYPRPGDKTKAHDPTVFDEGMSLYTRLGKPIVLAFGNHNVVTYEAKKPKVRPENEDVVEIKSMLNYQRTRVGFVPEDKTYFVKSYAEGVDVVVLDTNIMDDAEMLAWFDETVRHILSTGRQYYVVQHEPYFTAKETEKDGIKKQKFGSLTNGSAFLEIMFRYGAPIAVLCADTHYYQHGVIERIGTEGPPIHQIIVGTGGADPDAHVTGFDSHDFEGGYKLTKIKEDPGFGFLHVMAPDVSAARFVHVAPWPARPAHKGGRYAPRRRRSTQNTRRRRHAGGGRSRRTRRSSK